MHHYSILLSRISGMEDRYECVCAGSAVLVCVCWECSASVCVLGVQSASVCVGSATC